MISIILLVVIASLGLCYVGYVLLSSFLIVRGAPREDMFMCPKGHGPLPRTALIKFLGEDYCSICFHQKMKQAERGELR